ncbi:MAG: heliorhodopsin HeR [Candidatus Izimaplasma sp.]|nr:heliorhodopsin HeR [Candidatus Izimaplasma bacterium]
MEENIFEKLKMFNIKMGILHLVQGIVMLILAFTVIDAAGLYAPTITVSFLEYNVATESLELGSKDLFGLPFAVLVACFLFISAIAHAIISIPKKTNNIYNEDLKKGINRFRWYEYSLSSSIMIVLIATLFGVYDISTLLLIFFINASMNLFGLLMEKMNSGKEKKDVDWLPFIFGSVAGIIPWVVILIQMASTPAIDQVPGFVWAIVIVYFITFNTFPVNMILQYFGIGKWKDYFYGERVYIILSLVAKTLLAWLVFFGTMQP